jgi:hypothetical protein
MPSQYIYSSPNVTIYYSDEKKKIMHREDGPALVHSEGREWRINNKLHREDGPALEYANGRRGWYLHGIELTEEEHSKRTTNKN